MSDLFQNVPMAAPDPILGITDKFNADTRPEKVNLGVGVYYDESCRVPVMQAVAQAKEQLAANFHPRTYLPMTGIPAYARATQRLVFGEGSELITSGRAVTLQTLGGTGALRVGADFLKQYYPDSVVYVSDPTWGNHISIFQHAGYEVKKYPYFCAQTHGVDFDAMMAFLQQVPAKSIILLHACCHNPTGADLSPAQWDAVLELCQTRDLVPFMDTAYQGFGQGLEADAYALRAAAQRGISFLVSTSYSKSFSLYGERVGALTLVCQDAEEAARVLSQVKITVRTNYSNPPTFGGELVSTVLNTPELYQLWVKELESWRVRIHSVRAALVQHLNEAGVHGFEFVMAQSGMFSFSGLSKEQVARLATEFGVYAVGNGRICVAALNSSNVEYVAKAIAAVR